MIIGFCQDKELACLAVAGKYSSPFPSASNTQSDKLK